MTACAVQQERNEPEPREVPPLTARDLQLQEPRYAGALLHNMRAVLERSSMTCRAFFSDEQRVFYVSACQNRAGLRPAALAVINRDEPS